MNIHISLVLHSLVQEPNELVRALAGDDTTWHIFVHSRIPEVMEMADILAQDVPGVRLEQVGINRGLSRSWNQGIVDSLNEQADVVVIANDDLRAMRADLLLLAQGAMDCAHTHYFITADGTHKSANIYQSLQLALGALTPLAFETIGLFDENIWPVYHEDSEYYRRAELTGLKPYSVGKTNMEHGGATTAHTNPAVMRQLQIAVPRTEAYMLRKWGGSLNAYTYLHPFNDERIGLKIDIEERHYPYAAYGYDRTDYDEIMALA